MTSKADRRANAAEMRLGYRLMGIAFQSTAEVAAGLGIGWLVDKLRGGGNTGMMIGGILGVVVAMGTLIRQGIKTMKELDEIEKRRRRGE
ncbi:MAG: AtpZ/AtpI family protein [Phycisphaeraceae bacterium]|nr:AtpZ/AtpI family protein [Phycisphaeraceae bacterium]